MPVKRWPSLQGTSLLRNNILQLLEGEGFDGACLCFDTEAGIFFDAADVTAEGLSGGEVDVCVEFVQSVEVGEVALFEGGVRCPNRVRYGGVCQREVDVGNALEEGGKFVAGIQLSDLASQFDEKGCGVRGVASEDGLIQVEADTGDAY